MMYSAKEHKQTVRRVIEPKPAKKTVQMTTSMNFTTDSLNVGNAAPCPVGISMNAELDPEDPVIGSDSSKDSLQDEMMREIHRLDGGKISTSSGQYITYKSKNSYVKGHLLNHDLGGPGLAFNLFPITKQANRCHFDKVEDPIKKLLASGAEVEYDVYIKNISFTDGLPNADVECHVESSDLESGEKTVTIHSNKDGSNISGGEIEVDTTVPPSKAWSHSENDFNPENTAAHMTLNGNNVTADNLSEYM